MSRRYSHLKALKFHDRIEAIRSGTVAGPVHVMLVLSDLCNQDCHFCAFRDSSNRSSELFHEGDTKNPNRRLPTAKVLEILDDCAEMGVKAIELTGGGEPTIHPDFALIVRAILERGMQWGLITNGIRRQDVSTASWVRVSLDAARPETYARIRGVEPEHFHKAVESIRAYRPGVSYVVTQDNWREIVEATALVKFIGAHSIRIRAQVNDRGQHLFDECLPNIEALIEEAMRFRTPTFDVHNKFDEIFEPEFRMPQDYHRCGHQYFTTWIGGDQNLYRCCLYAYTPRGLIGSIKNRRFKDVWRELAWPGFESFDARGCTQCHYHPHNRAVNEMLDTDPNEAFV